nr:DUF1062 domain-containing protein [[Clostridium] scindens]
MRYCKKCGKKEEYLCSGEFRVNAQQKNLDIWLIYKCNHCNTTWNSAIYSRVSPQKLGADLLERFYKNDESLAIQYAMDLSLLHRNGVEAKMPEYTIIGEDVSLEKTVNIKIQSKYRLPLKISAILRKKLGITQRELEELILSNRIWSNTGQDIRKCRLSSQENTITISNGTKRN